MPQGCVLGLFLPGPKKSLGEVLLVVVGIDGGDKSGETGRQGELTAVSSSEQLVNSFTSSFGR